MKERVVLGIGLGLLMTLILSVVNHLSWGYNYSSFITTFVINGILFVPVGFVVGLIITKKEE